jgi:tRNA nucleotidyltransferase
MLPGAGAERTAREAVRGRQSGRTQEIQRLIGRALRAVVDMKALGERTIHIDCDVLQADGGTRTASVTGAFVALVEACATFYTKHGIFPVRDYVAAVSVGIDTEGTPLLDICYEEDSSAMVDMNLVMTGAGEFVEVQGTGEGRSFSRAEMNALLDLGERGIRELIEHQKTALGETLSWLPGREG